MKPFLSVIIPEKNEIERLPLTLIDIDRHLSEADYSYEILVVDGVSTDGTPELVERFKDLIANLKLIRLEEDLGKGGGVKKGMLEAQGQYRLFTDADNSTSIDQFNNMLPYFSAGGGSSPKADAPLEHAAGGKQGYDIVIGSRAIKGAKLDPPQSLFKRLLGKAGNLFIQIVLLPGIWDTQCGFKCFREEVALKVFPLQKNVGKPPWGFGFDAEVLALAKRMGYKIKEMPVHWVNDPFSTVTPAVYFAVLFETVKVRYWLWRNAYPSPFKDFKKN